MRHWLKWIAMAAVAVSAAPLASRVAPEQPYPGMLENDYVYTYSGGCHAIYVVNAPPKPEETNRTTAAVKGDCPLGLIHGPAVITYPVTSDGAQTVVEGEYFYGRQLFPTINTTKSRDASGAEVINAITWYLTGGTDYVKSVNLTDFANADWALTHRSTVTITAGGVYKTAVTWAPTCDETLRKAKFAGCKIGRTVYGVAYRVGSADETITPCPDVYSAAGCEKVWVQVTAALVADARRVIAQTLANDAALKARLGPIYTQWIADAPKRQAEADAAARRAAADEQARRDAADREARAAAERQRQADAQFQTSLKTLGPGELFARADELRRAGEVDKANQMLRALLSRFPNSPLAPLAAQQLMGTTSSAQPAPRVASSGGGAARSGRSCEDLLTELQGPNNAGQTPNAVSGAAGAELSVWAMQQYMALGRLLPQCRAEDLARVQSALAQEQQRCRQAGGSNCVDGADYRAPQYRQASREAFDRTVAAAKGGTPMASAAPVTGGGCSGTPDQELSAFNTDMERLGQMHPLPGAEAGARATYQYSYAYAVKGLELLEPRRACMGRHYQANHDALVGMRDSGKQGCEQLSSSGGACPREFQ